MTLMMHRTISLWVLAVITLMSIATPEVRSDDKNQGTKNSTPAASPADSTANYSIVVYYFHGNVRCATCKKIEALTKESIDSAYAAELKSGDLEWRVVNIDLPENKHFINDYQLYTRSVVLSDLHRGKQTQWKNLDKVWTLVRNHDQFVSYIQNEVTNYLDHSKDQLK